VSSLRPSDHPVLLSSLLVSATRPTLLENGPSVHPTVPRVSPSIPTRPTIAPTLAILVPVVHPTVSFLFLFFLVLDPSQFGMWYFGILGT
jgi:hypothetical protein